MTELRLSRPRPESPGNGGRGTDNPGLASVFLPPVVHEATVAVLVVDLRCRTVTFANDLARELAPEVPLPVSVDAWSAAAGLEDVTGADLPGGPDAAPRGQPTESLLRIAGGQPVMGEAVTANLATGATRAREVLWVLGLPLSGAPDPISSLALVVFMPARNARLIAGVQESASTLRERAVFATRTAFTITDPSLPDDPLVWVNPAFTEMTGYSSEDVVGRNCRFLQGADTNQRVVADIRRSLAEERQITTTLLNYRKDGSTFWNEVSISPVRDQAGTLTHYVGVQADVTSRVEAQQARDDALSQVALAADRLALLADFTSRMAMSQQPELIIQLLASVITPRIGTWCAVYTLDDNGRLTRPYLQHERQDTDTEIAADVARLRDVVPDQLPSSGPVWKVLRGEERQILVPDFAAAPPEITGASGDERTLLISRLGLASLVVVPLLARRGILGCVAVAADESRRALGDPELALIRDLAVRAGLMLENNQLYARERATATTLQRSLLPRLPQIDGIEVAASYVPAADEAAVGGDWYDVFQLRESDGVGVVVGDVMGHNYDSAARMGKLSTIVRAYAWPGSEPYTVLTAVDELLEGTDIDCLATCLYAKITRHTGGGATVHYSSAGHPPAIVRMPDGRASTLDDGRGPMMGVSRLMPNGSTRPEDAVIELPSGSTLICFTDGLTDAFSPEPDVEAGLAELCRLTAEQPVDASPASIVAALTGAVTQHNDDVAVVAIRIA